MYSSQTIIHEETLHKYYLARVELWYESENGKEKNKLTEVEYLTDGSLKRTFYGAVPFSKIVLFICRFKVQLLFAKKH
ncbi:hypothetical protein DHD32_21155 [Arenibacter sp. TNZ]|jgi:hypothetical protein|nr:hypothetical protein [Arenibacter sp. TNZ]